MYRQTTDTSEPSSQSVALRRCITKAKRITSLFDHHAERRSVQAKLLERAILIVV